jgi:beta-xylosidase
MTKHAGKYYLQYGAPGTEYNVYSTGVYTANDPLGPFTYAPYNPVAYKPGGFVQGAGHGNTFQDVHGNWWNTGTPWIAVNWNFERRIGLHPAGFDADGQMYVDTRFGDFPHWLPKKAWHTSAELFTGWMLAVIP